VAGSYDQGHAFNQAEAGEQRHVAEANLSVTQCRGWSDVTDLPENDRADIRNIAISVPELHPGIRPHLHRDNHWLMRGYALLAGQGIINRAK
jgi:hypothetical protein